MTTKIEWIKSKILSGVTDLSELNTPKLVSNPTPQPSIVKPVNIYEFAANLHPNDRRILQNEYAYRSLLINIEKNDLPAIQADIQNLATTPQISQSAIDILNAALLATTETIPDPNWQSHVCLTPAQQAGYDEVSVQEWMEASYQ